MHQFKNLSLASLAISTLALSSPLSGAVTVQDGLGGIPALAFETYDIDGGVSTSRGGAKDDRDLTQTFVLSSSINVDAFVLSVNQALAGESVTFRLFEVTSGANDANITLGTQLTSETYTFTTADATATGVAGDENLLTWDITDTTLNASTVYGLQIDEDGSPAGAVHIGWRSNGSNNYSGGALFQSGANQTNKDVTLGIVAVPEPSTYAMIAGFGALVLVMVRRRK